jgi:hypothetical protein
MSTARDVFERLSGATRRTEATEAGARCESSRPEQSGPKPMLTRPTHPARCLVLDTAVLFSDGRSPGRP